MHILVLGKSIFEGMAGTRRLQNNLTPLLNQKGIKISNLILLYKITKNNPLTKNLETLRITYNVYNPLSFIVYLYVGKRFIKSMYNINKKNILYVYNYPSIHNIIFIKYARKLGYKVVFDIVEDLHLVTDITNFFSLCNIKISLFYLKKIDNLCDGCIVISDHLHKLVKQHSGNKPLINIPISVNFKNFQDESKKEAIDQQVTSIFYGGSFGSKDGLDVLLEAIKIVSLKKERVRLIITGKGAKNNMKKVFRLIKEMKIKELIDYKGFLPYDEYYKTMLSVNIFCMTRVNTPYANAGFPFKLGEMLSTGKPVIVTKVGDVEKYLDNKSAVLINPNDSDSLAKAILYLIKNPQKASELGAEGKKRSEIFFDASKISESLYLFLNYI